MQNYSRPLSAPHTFKRMEANLGPEESMSERRTIMKPKVYIDGKEVALLLMRHSP